MSLLFGGLVFLLGVCFVCFFFFLGQKLLFSPLTQVSAPAAGYHPKVARPQLMEYRKLFMSITANAK